MTNRYDKCILLVKNYSCFNNTNWLSEKLFLKSQNKELKDLMSTEHDKYDETIKIISQINKTWQNLNSTYEKDKEKYLHQLNQTDFIIDSINKKYSNFTKKNETNSSNDNETQEEYFEKRIIENYFNSDRIYLQINENNKTENETEINNKGLPFLIEYKLYEDFLFNYLDQKKNSFVENKQFNFLNLAENKVNLNKKLTKSEKMMIRDIENRLEKVKTLNFLLNSMRESIEKKLNFTEENYEKNQAKIQTNLSFWSQKRDDYNESILNITKTIENNNERIKNLNDKIMLCDGKPLSYKKCADIYNFKEKSNEDLEVMIIKINEIIRDLLKFTKENNTTTWTFINATRCHFGNGSYQNESNETDQSSSNESENINNESKSNFENTTEDNNADKNSFLGLKNNKNKLLSSPNNEKENNFEIHNENDLEIKHETKEEIKYFQPKTIFSQWIDNGVEKKIFPSSKSIMEKKKQIFDLA